MVDMSIAAYERQSEGKELVGFGQGAVDPDSKWAWSNPATDMNGGHGEEITAPGPVVRHVVSFYIVGSIETGSAAKVKLETLKVRLLGGDQRAVAVLVSAEQNDRQKADAAIGAFLKALGSTKKVADAAAGMD